MRGKENLMNIKISVIVPVYNVENYLDRCLDSIINQTLKEIEIILVDDGSTDLSGKKCDEYKEKDLRIKVIHKRNEGLGYARNSGLEIANGKYIAFIDSDDYIDLKMFEDLYRYAEENKCEMALCYGNKRVNEHGKVFSTKKINNTTIYEGKSVKEKLLLDIIGSEPSDEVDAIIGVSVWKGIYLRNIFEKNNIKFCSERMFISEDAIFQLDFIPCINRAIVVPENYYYYCMNLTSLSLIYKKDRFDKNIVLYKEQLEKLKKLGIYDEAKIRVDRIFISNIRLSILQELRNNVSRKERLNNIKNICENKEVIKVLNSYPIKKLPNKQSIFCYIIKFKLVHLLYILSSLHEKAKYIL